MKNILSLLVVFSLIFTACTGQSTKFQTVEPNVFADKISKTESAQLIDVRTPEEYASEHIDKSVNINWNGGDFEKLTSNYDKNKPIFVYCKAGGRSAQASAKLAEMGFKEIYNLDGGMMKWNASGLGKPSTGTIGMTKTDYEKLLSSNKKVLIDFSAKWCGPCKKMAPYIAKMEKEMKNELVIIKIDADENKTLCQELQIDALPTLILYKDKKEIWKNIGYIAEEDLKKKL